MLKVDAALIAVVAAFFIPAMIAWTAKLQASAFVKSCVNVGASIVVGVVAVLSANPEGIPYREFIIAVAVSLFTSETMYNTVWKPTGAFRAIQQKFPGGIGSEVVLDSEPGLNPDEALHEVRDLVKPIFTVEQWQQLNDLIESYRQRPSQ